MVRILPSIDISVRDREQTWRWALSKTRAGRKAEHVSSLLDASKLADQYRDALTQQDQAGLPLIAFSGGARGAGYSAENPRKAQLSAAGWLRQFA